MTGPSHSTTTMARLFTVSLSLPARLSEGELRRIEVVFSELLDSVAVSHLRIADQSWLIEALFDFDPDRAMIAALLAPSLTEFGVVGAEPIVTPLEQRDWLAENRASFPPLHIGRFWVYGSHVKQARPAASLALLVDAAQAFGSGTHPTTEGCLRAIGMIATGVRSAPRKILDMGCGSAILAMAAQRVWPASGIIAADNDPVAVRVAAGNARQNGIAPRQLRCVVSSGFSGRVVRRSGPYDIILANILAGPLRRMAPQLMPHLAAGGWVILSGILNEQAVAVNVPMPPMARNAGRCCG